MTGDAPDERASTRTGGDGADPDRGSDSARIPQAGRVLEGIRRRYPTIVLAVVLLVLLAIGGVVGYYDTPLPVDRAAADSVREDPDVTVDRAYDGYVLRPRSPGDGPTTALVFYPGGRVDPESYLYTLAPLVERGNLRVYVPGMTLNLAVLDGGAAAEVIADNPGVDRWYVGGHSLGGAFACRYAADNPGRVDGVVLFASYCDRSPAEDDPTLVVVGGRDRVLDRESFEDNRGNLPDDARVVRIDGMNHSQFGAYSGQPGDVPATIDRETARERLVAAVLEWHRNRTAPGGAGSGRATPGAGPGASDPDARAWDPGTGASDPGVDGVRQGTDARVDPVDGDAFGVVEVGR